MHKDQPVKIKELTQGVVCGSDSLSALFTTNTDADMRFHDHRHVVSTITDR